MAIQLRTLHAVNIQHLKERSMKLSYACWDGSTTTPVRQEEKYIVLGVALFPARKGAVGGCSFIKQLWLNAVFKF